MKTKALSSLLILISINAGAEGFNTFACLRELLPLTDHGFYQRKRAEVEKPFVSGEKYIVFPEVLMRKVTGFYVYDQNGAYYYDTIEIRTEAGAQAKAIGGLSDAKERPLYQMVAQPGGLETMTIYYMPGFKAGDTNLNGPVYLGASVLPVIGALVSRPEKYDYVYQSPQNLTDLRLQEWLAKNKGGRSPASEQKIERKLVSLTARSQKDEKVIWRPLKEELRFRREWIREHNIDNQTFKKISKAMEGPCKER